MSVVGVKAEQTDIAPVNIIRVNILWNLRGTGA